MDPFDAYLLQAQGVSVRAGFARLQPEQLDPGEVTVRLQYASVNY